MALGAGSNLRPGGTKRQWGEDGRRRGPGPAGPSRAPLPLPRGRQQRREPPGPVGKMADGPGVACHPRRRQRPAMPGRNLGWGGGLDAPRNPRRPIASLGAPAASVFPSTPPRKLSLSHPTGSPRADASRDPATRPRPTPTPARPDPGAPGVPACRAVRQPAAGSLPEAVSAAGRRAARAEAGGRRQRRAGSREAGGCGGPSARRWRDPRLPPTPRWRPSRLLLRPAKSGTFKNPCARNGPPARPRALPPSRHPPPRPGRLGAPQRPPEGPGPPSHRPQDRPTRRGPAPALRTARGGASAGRG
ncbi:proline-rich protein 2-like [Eschrichtius robustus]|uniref:proline-rich protein 2-like n=1 Tax=Eschrichtius robustus TaxID=9764 RepID=UPI0035C01567